MNARRSRKIVLWAIALSLLAHLLFALYFHFSLASTGEQEPRVARIQLTRIATAPPKTPPPPRTPVVHTTIAPPHLQSKNTGTPSPHRGIAAPVSTLPPVSTTPTPKPTPTATPSLQTSAPGQCTATTRNAPAALASTPDPIDIPPDARASKVSGTAQIKVVLDAQGHVTDATVAQTSGNDGLDRVALQLAHQATYTPKFQDCKAVAGEYMFSVQFKAL